METNSKFAKANSLLDTKQTFAFILNSSSATFLILTWAWNKASPFAVCIGIRTFMRNCLCSAFSGNAKPLMMLGEKGRRLGSRFDSRSYTSAPAGAVGRGCCALLLQGTVPPGVLYTLSRLSDARISSMFCEKWAVSPTSLNNLEFFYAVNRKEMCKWSTAYQHLGKNSCSEYLMKTSSLPSWSPKQLWHPPQLQRQKAV